MDDLYVGQKHRGSGIGSKLIKKVIEKAKAVNCRKIRWQVTEWNQSVIDFYESLVANIDRVEMSCDFSLT